MDDNPARESETAPRADTWLAAGMSSLAAGLWLIQRDDPFLLTLWGVSLSILGVVAVTLGLGLLLRLWR
jgi:hypothetical protein